VGVSENWKVGVSENWKVIAERTNFAKIYD
jgi:hypothetical protein